MVPGLSHDNCDRVALPFLIGRTPYFNPSAEAIRYLVLTVGVITILETCLRSNTTNPFCCRKHVYIFQWLDFPIDHTFYVKWINPVMQAMRSLCIAIGKNPDPFRDKFQFLLFYP